MPEATTRQTALFRNFVELVHDNCLREREVSFYANRRCISTPYLSTIVRNVVRCSVKEFIDRSVMLEIKMLLQSTNLSVQEIAYRLCFPRQPYLGRFFKKHTGESIKRKIIVKGMDLSEKTKKYFDDVIYTPKLGRRK